MARVFSLREGASFVDEVLKIARKEKVRTARVEAIGGVRKLRLAYFDHRRKRYEEHVYTGFLEVTGILGNITLMDSKPFLHAHGTFARRDMSVIGGHIMAAEVFPILEVVITPTSNKALRAFDEEIGLNVIKRIEG